MLKILYAAGNTESSKIQLSRFFNAIKDKPYLLKIAAYKKSSPPINIDWTLDCLLDIFNSGNIILDNDNFHVYFDQIKSFKPDLIISDLEYFTSYAANVLNIPLWQCSSSIFNFAFSKKQKYNTGLFKKYSFILNRHYISTVRIANILENSSRKFIYSHFGDLDNSPEINEGYEWIRPYHNIGKKSILCQHNVVASLFNTNKKILSLLSKQEDVVAFTPFTEEYYKNIVIKNIINDSEYFCNIKNSKHFICEGQTSFLADAFYNNKKSLILMNYHDLECVSNSIISENLNLGINIYNDNLNLEDIDSSLANANFKNNIKFLHEKIEEI